MGKIWGTNSVFFITETKVFEGRNYADIFQAATRFIKEMEKAGETVWIASMEADHDATGHRLKIRFNRGILNQVEFNQLMGRNESESA